MDAGAWPPFSEHGLDDFAVGFTFAGGAGGRAPAPFAQLSNRRWAGSAPFEVEERRPGRPPCGQPSIILLSYALERPAQAGFRYSIVRSSVGSLPSYPLSK